MKTRKPSESPRAKVVREMRVFSGGDPTAMCKAGVEIHFKPKPHQTSKTMAALRRFKRDISASSCFKLSVSLSYSKSEGLKISFNVTSST